MLTRLHTAKTKKEALRRLKEEALAESKARAAKAKARRLQISALATIQEEDDDYVKPMMLTLGLASPTNTVRAMLDSGADTNVMSEAVYQRLIHTPLEDTTVSFTSFSNQQTSCKGKVTVMTHIQEHFEPCTFYVTESNQCAHDVILGRSWMHKHQFNYDWIEQTVMLSFGKDRLYIREHDPIQKSKKDLPASKVTKEKEKKSTQVTTQPRAEPHKAEKVPTPMTAPNIGRSPSRATTLFHTRWQPRQMVPTEKLDQRPKPSLPNHIINPKKEQPKKQHTPHACKKQVSHPPQFRKTYQPPRLRTEQRWVPKKLLQAQGYYQGNNHLWIQKLKSTLASPRQPKEPVPPTLPQPLTQQVQETEQRKWLPKQAHLVPLPKTLFKPEALAGSNAKEPKTLPKMRGVATPYPTIQERAHVLQGQLHGWSSTKCSPESQEKSAQQVQLLQARLMP